VGTSVLVLSERLLLITFIKKVSKLVTNTLIHIALRRKMVVR